MVFAYENIREQKKFKELFFRCGFFFFFGLGSQIVLGSCIIYYLRQWFYISFTSVLELATLNFSSKFILLYHNGEEFRKRKILRFSKFWNILRSIYKTKFLQNSSTFSNSQIKFSQILTFLCVVSKFLNKATVAKSCFLSTIEKNWNSILY